MTYENFLSGSTLSNGIGGAINIGMQPGATSGVSITTTGQNAHGVFAQSLSGGGGAVGSVNGIVIPTASGNTARSGSINDATTPGAININLSGTISTSGSGSVGIYAQSGVQGTSGAIISPASSNGAIAVNFTGNITGGSGTGAAIQVDGGGANTITIGANSTVRALSGTAILGGIGSEAVTNNGTVVGNINLSTGNTNDQNSFTNTAGAIYRSSQGVGSIVLAAPTVNPAAGVFTNNGTFNVGGSGFIATANLTGSLIQSTTGQLIIDINALAPQNSDTINVSNIANVSGTIQVKILQNLLPGSYTVLTANQGLSNSAVGAQAPGNNYLPVTWTTGVSGNSLTVSPRVNFAPQSLTLNGNEQAYANYLQSSWNQGGSSTLAPVYGQLANINTAAKYVTALDTGSSQHFGTAGPDRLTSVQAAMSAVMSCPEFQTIGTLLHESDCSWFRVIAGQAAQYSTPDAAGYSVSSITYRGGMQKEVAPDWFVGLSAAYDTNWETGNYGNASSSGQGFDVAGAIKHQMGPWLISLATDIGYMWYNNDRSIYLTDGVLQSATSSSNALTASGRLRVNYEVPFDTWYVKPYADLDIVHVSLPGFSESGTSGANLNVQGSAKTMFGFSPNVEVGGRWTVADSWTVRPYSTIGASVLSSSKWTTAASLQGVPTALGTFNSTTNMPLALANLGLGAQILNKNGLELRVEVSSQISAHYLSETGSARIAYHF
jgi:uncharacterized protein with beta-barrel porin domain